MRAAFNPLLLGKLKPSKWKDISCNLGKLHAGGDQSIFLEMAKQIPAGLTPAHQHLSLGARLIATEPAVLLHVCVSFAFKKQFILVQKLKCLP